MQCSQTIKTLILKKGKEVKTYGAITKLYNDNKDLFEEQTTPLSINAMIKEKGRFENSKVIITKTPKL